MTTGPSSKSPYQPLSPRAPYQFRCTPHTLPPLARTNAPWLTAAYGQPRALVRAGERILFCFIRLFSLSNSCRLWFDFFSLSSHFMTFNSTHPIQFISFYSIHLISFTCTPSRRELQQGWVEGVTEEGYLYYYNIGETASLRFLTLLLHCSTLR